MKIELTFTDIGKVFVKAADAKSKEYLLLRHVGDGLNPVYSFVTFSVQGNRIRKVGDTGYFKGIAYHRVELPSAMIAEVERQYRAFTANRLKEIQTDTSKLNARESAIRSKFKKTGPWSLIAEGTAQNPVRDYVVWLDPTRRNYVIEIYDSKANLTADVPVPCSHEPEFGIDPIDAEAVSRLDVS